MVGKRAISFIFGVFLFAGLAGAQTVNGSLVGNVEDSTKARIAGAEIKLVRAEIKFERTTKSDAQGEFRLEDIPPGEYRVTVSAGNFKPSTVPVTVAVSSTPTLTIRLEVAGVTQTTQVTAQAPSYATQPIETTSSIQKGVVTAKDLALIPLASRSFANIAYLTPMTEPVEPSDPTKARITAVSFGGSSGLNVDLSVDGGDNNDDWIGGFLQNYSVDSIQEFAVRTAQFDADTSRTNGGSVIITTRRGTDDWHGGGAYYYRGQALNARNVLDNPLPDPKQPFSRWNGVGTIGGPLVKQKLWLFSSLEYVDENASIAYNTVSQTEFAALAHLANLGLIPGVSSIPVPTSTPVPFRDTLYTARLDWTQSPHSQWFLRFGLDRNRTLNDLVQQATLPSTGATTHSNYYSTLLSNAWQFNDQWLGTFTFQASEFYHSKDRNSNLGEAFAFPFSSTTITTSGFETFGDNQFITAITAFPIRRTQEKYQARYDVIRAGGTHSVKFGVNFIHEPVLSGLLATNAETLFQFTHDPSFYAANPALFSNVINCDPNVSDCTAINCDPISMACDSKNVNPATNGFFHQSIQRLGLYVQDSWRVRPSFTINYGLRWDTTFGLFKDMGLDQTHNPAVATIQALGLPLATGIPHDYRKAFAPRLGIAWAPGASAKTVFRAGVGMYYNDLMQNGWVDALRAVMPAVGGPLGPGDQGAVIDPNYSTPYAIEASAGFEHEFTKGWRMNIQYEHMQGVHQYRRYEYTSAITLPADAPNISVFRTDNRSQYDGVSFIVQHRFSSRFEMTAHYTLAKATTWGATVGELFDYVNGVSNVNDPFGPGDHGPSGEDVRHRFVLEGTVHTPGGFDVSTLTQAESARPFTMTTPVDINGDGVANDRAVVNGVQTSLDEFRGTPFFQIDLRIAREFHWHDRLSIRPFAELFNLLNRSNPGNNFIPDISALPVNSPANATAICLNAACTQTQAITSLNQLRVPAGALGDFFGPGTTVGIPFAAQFGLRVSF
jgi:hypothetical protein